MKLNELMVGQRVVIQIVWGDHKLEFFANVKSREENKIRTTAYIHNGKELDLNINQDSGVICTLFANKPVNNQRMSWKGIEITSIKNRDETEYLISTNGFNYLGKNDDRRLHNRMIINKKGQIYDSVSNNYTDVIIHDVSDIGISFYAPTSFVPKSQQLTLTFDDDIEEKSFSVKVDATITRTVNKAGNQFNGCRVIGENKNYLIYVFMLRLHEKKK